MTLDNGLQIVAQATASPLCAACLWVEAGCIDEEPDELGAAHFLEHMLFKATDRRAIGGAAAEIEGLGGDLNAFTSHDETAIHAVVEAGAAERALDVLADLIRGTQIPAGEFERERAVVIEEVRGYDEDADTVADEAVSAMLFPGHAYGRPITGTIADVTRLSQASVAAFRARNHGANRATLAIAGGIDPEAIITAVRRLFGGWHTVGQRVERPVPAGPTRARLERAGEKFESLAVQLGWRAPGCDHPDHAALEVLIAALADGPASVLAGRLVVDDGVATDVWGQASLQLRGGSLTIGFPPRDGKTTAGLDAAIDEIAHVVAHGVPARYVERARDVLLADMLFEQEGVDSVAHDLVWYRARWGDEAARERHRVAIASVTPRQIARVAREWLDLERVSAVVLDNRANPKKLGKALERAPRVAVSAPGPARHVHRSGAIVWVLPDESPVCAVHAAAIGGRLFENPKNNGLVDAWARTVSVAADDLDATAFGEALDDVAGEISGWEGRSTQGLRATFPAHHALEGLDLWAAALVKPRFDSADVERTRDEMHDDLRVRVDHPDEIASMLLFEALFPDHPWRLPSLGTTRSVTAIGDGALHKLHGSVLTADNTVIAVAGGVDAAAVIEALEPWLDELPRGPHKLPATTPLAAAVPQAIVKRSGRGASQVVVGLRGPAIDHADATAIAVIAALMDGQGGRLFLDLRERRGLAYDVWGDAWCGHGGGVVQFGLSTDPARAREAATALNGALDDLVARPPDAAEVGRYTRMLAGRHALALERASARAGDCADNARHGLPWGLAAHRSRVLAVDERAIARAIGAWLAGPRVEVVVEPGA